MSREQNTDAMMLSTSEQFDDELADPDEVRPRALWIIAPPPTSRYAASRRRVCLMLSPTS
jgi:hypothetical protein